MNLPALLASPIRSRSRIYRGMSFSRDEIVQAKEQVAREFLIVSTTIDLMLKQFDAENMVDTKIACEVLNVTATDSAAKISRSLSQIAVLSKSLANTFATHLARRARI